MRKAEVSRAHKIVGSESLPKRLQRFYDFGCNGFSWKIVDSLATDNDTVGRTKPIMGALKCRCS